MSFELDRRFAEKWDEEDPLKCFRDRFFIPKTKEGKEEIYLCGNSLGLQPKTVRETMEIELADWERLGVKAHFEGRFAWKNTHEFVTKGLAEVVGAKESEVVAMNTLTVNLHLLMVSFYRPTKKRFKILIETGAFPSDRYAVDSQIKFHGFDPQESMIEVASEDGAVLEALDKYGEEIALVLLPGVQYLSGYAFDIEMLSQKAHEKGCSVGWDLAHAVGNIPLTLHESEADFAVWCSYKYLNAGPGATAGAFVHERHHKNHEMPRFAGWWGHNKETRFKMDGDFDPISSAEGWQLSNPSVFGLAPLRDSLKIFLEADVKRLREKSIRLTNYLEFLIQKKISHAVEILTPSQHRGCQLSLNFESLGEEKFHSLLQRGVSCDWREPGIVRAAPTPLYNQYVDCYDFVTNLEKILE